MPSSPDPQGDEGEPAQDNEDERIPSDGRPAPDKILIQVDVIYHGKAVDKGEAAHRQESFVHVTSAAVRQKSAHDLSFHGTRTISRMNLGYRAGSRDKICPSA